MIRTSDIASRTSSAARRRSLALGLTLAMAGAALAQTSPPVETADNAPPVLQEVIITGSRIPQPNTTSTSPIQVVDSQQIQQQGATDAVQMLGLLPQNFQNASTDFSNTSNALGSAGGITTADLRGLGPQRTLVLIDGRRLGAADPNTNNPNPAPDLDQIPVGLIERVEVVTGGASAVYGSDAIAGVVNFIMKRNFEGIQIGGQWGADQFGNHNNYMQEAAIAAGFPTTTARTYAGQNKDFSILAGTKVADGKGNITAWLEYRSAQPVSFAARDYTSCELISGIDIGGGAPNTCIGSGNSNHFGVNGTTYSVIGNQLLPPQPGSFPPETFNSNPYIDLSRQDQRYLAGFMAHVDVSDAIKPYINFSFMDDKTTTQVAPSGLFYPAGNVTTADVPGVGGQYLVNCSNPLLSAQEQSVLCTPAQVAADAANPGSAAAVVDIGRRNIEGGPRVAYYDHINYRAVAGIQGGVGSAWTYDAYGQYYYTTLFNSNSGYLNYSAIDNALEATGTAANPTCVNRTASGCVPYNIWTTGGVTPAQLAYLTETGTANGAVAQRILHADVTGDLAQYGLQSPLANDGLGINFGYEHRSEHLDWSPDAAEISGDLAGFSGAVVPIHAGYSVSEGFIEARAPVAQNLNWVKELSADAGYRYSKYSTAGHTNTYKFEVQYAPTGDGRLRASYERAVRAPNIIELFNPPAYGQQSFLGVDPCAGATPTATLAQCEHTGVTAAQYGTIPQCVSDQCGQITGGNTALKPEVADTYTVGLTVTPTPIPHFSGSVDFFNINLKNEIGTVAGGYLFNQCLNTGDPAYCNLIVRNHVNGALTGATVSGGGYIVQTDVNIARVVVRGLDFQATYRYTLPGGWGTITPIFTGSWLLDWLTTPGPGQHTYNCVGLFGAQCNTTVNPRWRHVLRVNWETPFNLLLSLQWRFIGKTGSDNNDPDPSLFGKEVGAYDPYNTHIPNYSYLDLSAIYTVREGITVRAGINNLFDKDPPIVAVDYTGGAGSPNTFPTYDLLGREAFVGITAKF
jgi:outer membrane receptor protein involved in Fe transport